MAEVTRQKLPPLYHWAPRERRESIALRGLLPGMLGRALQEWRAPYVCLAESPSWAWALSGMGVAEEGEEWDLWQANVNGLRLRRRRSYDEVHRWAEVRVFEPVGNGRIWWVAGRVATSAKR